MIDEVTGKSVDTAGGYHTDPCFIAGGDGEGEPVLNESEIILNGKSPHDHETFSISLTGNQDFCKTARKPYDIVVVALLAYCAAKHGFDVSSDGDSEEWAGGVELIQRVTGEPIPNPLIVEALVGG